MSTGIGKHVILLISSILFSASAFSQRELLHEFSVWGLGGSTSLKSSMNEGKNKSGFGGAMGLGYTFNATQHLGVGTGVEAALYNSRYDIYNMTDQYTPSTLYHLSYQMDSYSEQVSSMFLNIPLMFQYQSLGNYQRIYGAIGGKVGIPFNGKSKADAGTFRVDATVPVSGLPVVDSESIFGFVDKPKTRNDLSFKMAYMLSAEFGIKWRLSENMHLYTGAYIDYTLNNLLKDDKHTRLIEFNGDNSPNVYSYNSIATSLYYDKESEENQYFIKKISPVSFGIKAKLSFFPGGDSKYRKLIRKQHLRNEYMDQGRKMQEDVQKQDVSTVKKRVEEKKQNTMNVDMKSILKDHYDKEK